MKNYTVSCVIDEGQQEVKEVKCHDCPASEGGCKHSVAFLMWLHRRSEEPSPTDTICYWKKSKLAGSLSSRSFITTSDFGPPKKAHIEEAKVDTFFRAYIEEAKKLNIKNTLLSYNGVQKFHALSLHTLFHSYKKNGDEKDADSFLSFCKMNMSMENIKEIEEKTRDQSQCLLWSEIRFARITASKAFEVTRCKKHDGVLIDNIFGAKIFQSSSMERGLRLENSVIEELSKQTKLKFHRTG